jgi:hypothetical protein
MTLDRTRVIILVAVAVVGLAGGGCRLQTAAPRPTESQAAATPPPDEPLLAGVAALNRYRAAANVAPVAPDASGAAAKHAHYLALNRGSQATAGLRVHHVTAEPY